jgi:tetratricopeptide (TPR) repeat protein
LSIEEPVLMSSEERVPKNKTGRGGWRRAGTVVLAMALLAGCIFSLQRTIDSRFQRRRIERLLYIPSGRFLKPAVLGYDNLAADYLWMKAIGYFGGHYMSDQKYPWLPHILELITDLDPRFRIVYYFGGIVLAIEADKVEESTALLEKGMENFPDYWKFPFFIGFNHFYYRGDFVTAAEYISRAATLPGHPEYLPKLAASLYARGGRLEDAVAFLWAVEANLEDERLKRKIREKIGELESGVVPGGIDQMIRERKRKGG